MPNQRGPSEVSDAFHKALGTPSRSQDGDRGMARSAACAACLLPVYVDHDKSTSALAPDPQEGALFDILAQVDGLPRIADLFPIDFHEKIAGSQPGPISGRARLHAHDQSALQFGGDAKLLAQPRVQFA